MFVCGVYIPHLTSSNMPEIQFANFPQFLSRKNIILHVLVGLQRLHPKPTQQTAWILKMDGPNCPNVKQKLDP